MGGGELRGVKEYVHIVKNKNIRGSPGMSKSISTAGPQTPFPEDTCYQVLLCPYQESTQVGAYV